MSFTLIHDLVMVIMGGVILFATYLIIERWIFFSATLKEGKAVDAFVRSHLNDKKLHGQIIEAFDQRGSPQAQAICEVVKASQDNHSHEQMEYIVQSIYVAKQPTAHSRLWMLDTIITPSADGVTRHHPRHHRRVLQPVRQLVGRSVRRQPRHRHRLTPRAGNLSRFTRCCFTTTSIPGRANHQPDEAIR